MIKNQNFQNFLNWELLKFVLQLRVLNVVRETNYSIPNSE